MCTQQMVLLYIYMCVSKLKKAVSNIGRGGGGGAPPVHKIGGSGTLCQLCSLLNRKGHCVCASLFCNAGFELNIIKWLEWFPKNLKAFDKFSKTGYTRHTKNTFPEKKQTNKTNGVHTNSLK